MDLFLEMINIVRTRREAKDVPVISQGCFFDASAVDAGGSEAATRGCPSVGAEGATIDHGQVLFDLLEHALKRYVVQGTRSMINLDPNAPRDSYGKHVNFIPSDMITGPDPGRGRPSGIWPSS